MGFPTENDHFWGVHLRKHPCIYSFLREISAFPDISGEYSLVNHVSLFIWTDIFCSSLFSSVRLVGCLWDVFVEHKTHWPCVAFHTPCAMISPCFF